MRRSLAPAVALFLVLALAAPAGALTVHRVFRAGMGTAGANGTIAITSYTNGAGRVEYALTSLRASRAYRVEVRKGRCGRLGSLVVRLADVRTSTTGTVTRAQGLSIPRAQKIWKANWSSVLAVRVISGSSIRCGNLNFTRATRVRVAAQGVLNRNVDLPIVRGPSGYPYCKVAMYMGALNQPAEPAKGATFLYAHARKGMFLPLLDAWKKHQRGKGKSMVGLQVQVWTSDNQVHTYRISRVVKTNGIQAAVRAARGSLWLQTSTGPNYTYPKLLLKATRVSSEPSTYEAAHPKATVVKCR